MLTADQAKAMSDDPSTGSGQAPAPGPSLGLGTTWLAVLRGCTATVAGGEALDVALECGLSAYDAELVVLARTLGVPLVTLDGGILEGAGDVVVPLGEASSGEEL